MHQRRHALDLALYERVLADFLADSSDPGNLPHGLARRLVRTVV